MRTLMKWLAPVMGFAILIALPSSQSRGDETSTTATAKVTITVVDGSGKPVANAMVRLVKRAHAAKTSTDTGAIGQARPKITPVAHGMTGSDGTISFSNIADGHYGALARAKGVGRGMARVSVSGSGDVAVTVTLEDKVPTTQNSPN